MSTIVVFIGTRNAVESPVRFIEDQVDRQLVRDGVRDRLPDVQLCMSGAASVLMPGGVSELVRIVTTRQ